MTDLPAHPMTPGTTPPDDAACLGCGYALRGLASRSCPECGREFDPANEWTMSVPRTPFDWQKRILEPTDWPFRKIRRTLIIATTLSAWCPAPNPLPILWLGFYWLRWGVPCVLRSLERHRLVYSHRLPREMLRADRPGIWRLRRMFAAALVVIGLHLPFFAAYAVSSPFLARSARYWLTRAPMTEQPRPGPAVYGVMPVLHREVRLRSVTYWLPGGPIVFQVGGDDPDGIEVMFLESPAAP